MGELSIAPSAHSALSKLLARLKLIEAERAERKFTFGDRFPIGQFADEGLFIEDDALSLVASKLNLEIASIQKSELNDLVTLLDHQDLARVPLQTWRKIRAIPVEVNRNSVVIAFANPLDQQLKSALEFAIGKPVTMKLASEAQIVGLLSKKQQVIEGYALSEIIEESEANGAPESPAGFESSIMAGDVESAPVVRLANKILLDAVAAHASDIHLSPERDRLVVKIRVDGMMRELFSVPGSLSLAIISRLKLLGNMDISERRKPQDGRFRLKTTEGVKDLRLSTLPTAYGENFVARVLSPELTRVSFDSLGMSPELEARFRLALTGSSRVVLVTGPTGSGKTSSLYAGLIALQDGSTNIITVEDPIEYRVPGVQQIQVNAKVGLTFAEGLRSILRQDPDIVIVGEIRDKETAAIAMQVAQTGHLVLSTVHTNSAPAAITRLLDLEIPPYLIASSLGAVLAQRLVRKLCPHCKEAPKEGAFARLEAIGLNPMNVRVPRGCPECLNSGYSGRVGIFSFLEFDEDVRDAVRDAMGEDEIERRARESGFKTLVESGLELAGDGVTSIEELERVLGPIGSGRRVRRADGSAKSTPPVDPARLPDQSVPSVLSKRKVLVVEDDENSRVILSTILQREMYEVVEAANGEEGLKLVFNELPSLIISDVMMPRMDGIEMVRIMRSDPRTQRIPVLMLTAVDDEENEVALLNAGANDFLGKGSDAKVLLARVRRLLA